MTTQIAVLGWRSRVVYLKFNYNVPVVDKAVFAYWGVFDFSGQLLIGSYNGIDHPFALVQPYSAIHSVRHGKNRKQRNITRVDA